MYPKLFHETFMEGDPRDELFVCMPFHKSFKEKFKAIEEAANNIEPKLKTKRVDRDPISNDITHEIFDGILNSRLVLFDLSDDPKTSNVNINVMYELGFANSVRAPQSIILIRDESSKSEYPFNIANLSYIPHKSPLEVGWFKKVLVKSLENKKVYNERIIKIAARSMDSFGLKLILSIYKTRPAGRDHFNDEGLSVELKLAILRLMDLGIIWFATDKSGTEYAYHWTSFGEEVINYLGIEKMKN